MRPRLLFVVTEESFFCSHRLPLARAARAAGYEVTVATRPGASAGLLRQEGIAVEAADLGRGADGPLAASAAVVRLAGLYRRLRPDLVHHVALKPIVYGSLAAGALRGLRVVNAVTGLGYVFTSSGLRARLLRQPLKTALRACLGGRGRAVIAQNSDDRIVLARLLGKSEDEVDLIRGSGVNFDEFAPSPEPPGSPVVLFASRMLWSKGVGEFVEAARVLKAERPDARFLLAGAPDSANPESVPEERLRAWHEEGVVERLGSRADMPRLLAGCHLFVLPTAYGEGVPKALIEAAASGRPIVTSDAPGCREIVRHGRNGLLVPPRDRAALVAAIRALLDDPAARAAMGRAGREIALDGFGEDEVVRRTLAVYDRLLGRGGR